MSFLQDAHHFNVERLNITTNTTGSYYGNGLETLLSDRVAFEAMHDSSQRVDAPKCHPETRGAVQEEILSWITHGDSDERPCRVMWLTGAAGAGKTAIAGTIAEICEERGLLCATFFFSSFAGSASRSSKRYLVPTLAYQMTRIGDKRLRENILIALGPNSMIFEKRLKTLLETLVLGPLRQISTEKEAIARQLIIIDGLDEVTAETPTNLGRDEARQANEADQIEILSALLHAANDPAFPFRIMIASRPERVIREFFSGEANRVSRQLILDDKYDPGADIALYLRSSFAEIRRRYNLPPSWASEGVILNLVQRASGQFIYAATVVRFLRSGTIPPHARLECVLSLRHEGNPINPFEPLDALYLFILNSSPHPVLAVQWVSVLEQYLTGDALRPKVPRFMFAKQLLEEYPGQGDYLFENLTSLIAFSSVEKEPTQSYHLHHKSLIDFFKSPQRCGRAFYEAFSSAHDDLYVPRMAKIFESRSPVHPLDSTQYAHFVHAILALPILRRDMEMYIDWAMNLKDGTSDAHLWDMHTAVLHFAAYDPVVTAACVVKFFYYFHSSSGCGLLLSDCTPTCRHWRSRILQSCRAFGWTVPTPLDMFRQIIYEAMGGWLHISNYFRRPSRPLDPPPDLEYQSPWGTCDYEYETFIDDTMTMHSKLPADWERQFKERVEGGVRRDELYDIVCREIGVTSY